MTIDIARRRLMGGAIAAAALGVPMPGRAQQPSLKIGMANANMTVTYPYISSTLALGMFEEEGVKVEVVHGQNSPQILGLLVGRTVDLVYCNPEPVIQLVADRGANLKSVFVVQVSQYILTAPEGSPVKSVQDLKGKRLGMASPVSGIDYLKARLQDAGMTVSDIEIVPTGFAGQVIAALQQKRVDAILYWSDAIAQFRYAGIKLNDLPKAEWESGLYQYIAVTTQQVIDQKADALQRALRAMARAQMLTHVSPELTIQAFYKQYPDQAPKEDQKATVFEQNMARVKQQNTITGIAPNPTKAQLMKHRWGENSLDAWGRMQSNLLRVGSLQKKVDPATFFDNRFIDYANKFDREKVYQLAEKYKGGLK
ncbi:MAG TPA: ABC transporter substrate-binding protein [Burkholderiales bacterium]|nr:ABC transporter substrate-binding protein [Burkholderiales bacterium]